jgi:hypothetical protein
MAKAKNNDSGGSFFSKIFAGLMLLVTAGFAIALLVIFQAQDLSDIEGYSGSDSQSTTRDITTVLEKAIEGQYSVVITELEINRMLQEKIELKQGGYLASMVSIKSALVRLKDGYAEIIVVRDIAGVEFTGSIFVQVEQAEDREGIYTQVHLHGGPFNDSVPSLKRGGRFGKLTVPQGFIMILMPDFQKIAEALDPEVKLGFRDMARYKIEEGRFTLDPRRPTEERGMKNDVF